MDREPHKWAEVIHAIADGKDVQLYYYDGWHDYDSSKHNSPIDNPESEWRIKPEPKPDVVRTMLAGVNGIQYFKETEEDNLKLTFDGETGKLKSAEVINYD